MHDLSDTESGYTQRENVNTPVSMPAVFKLSLAGRFNRSNFILASLIIAIAGACTPIAAVLLIGLGIIPTVILEIIGIMWAVLLAVAGVRAAVLRLHDLGKGGVWWLLTLVPVVNFFFGIYLLFFKGNTGANEYGRPTKGSSAGTILLLFIVLMILSGYSYTVYYDNYNNNFI